MGVCNNRTVCSQDLSTWVFIKVFTFVSGLIRKCLFSVAAGKRRLDCIRFTVLGTELFLNDAIVYVYDVIDSDVFINQEMIYRLMW